MTSLSYRNTRFPTPRKISTPSLIDVNFVPLITQQYLRTFLVWLRSVRQRSLGIHVKFSAFLTYSSMLFSSGGPRSRPFNILSCLTAKTTRPGERRCLLDLNARKSDSGKLSSKYPQTFGKSSQNEKVE